MLGAVIGYITNDIAIKMLFHPRKAYYIGKFHIPFTPGLIPQQKRRIAESVGHVVSTQLLNSDTLKSAVLSENAVETLRGRIHALLEGLAEDTRSLRDLLLMRFTEEQIHNTKESICGQAAGFIMKKLTEAHLGAIIADAIAADIQKSMPEGGLSGRIAEVLSKSLASTVEKVVENKLREKGPALVEERVAQSADDLLDLKLCRIYQSQKDRLPQIEEGLIGIYREALEVNLDKLLSAVNIESIIVEKVNSFDAAQLEAMIFGILKRELKAIVYLGAALGFLMGFVNLLF